MSHTREPWEWSEHQFNAPPYEGRLNNECGIYPPDGECGPVALVGGKEDARRIVACVNACKGIKTESLEMEVLSWITDETGQSALKRERDELLEARAACGERLIEVLKERDELLSGRLIEEPLRRRISELLVTLQGVIDRCAPSGYVGQDGQYLKRVRAVVARLGAGETVADEAV